MAGSERVPLTAAEMDRWTVSTALDDAAVVAVAAGLDPAGEAEGGLTAWSVPTLPGLPHAALDARLRTFWDPDQPARSMIAPLRLVVRGPLLPTEVVPRLLSCPAVGSAILPVERPPGALLRRDWSWPLRVGIADDALRDQIGALRNAGIVPRFLAEVTDVREGPGAVDLLVLRGTPAEAAAFAVARRQVANAVLCIADSGDAWPITDAHFALVRAASAAVLTALVPHQEPEESAHRVLHVIRYLSHAHPFDVALTAAFDRRILIAAESDAVARLDLPALLRRHAARARRESGLIEAPPPPRMVEAAPAEIEPPPFDPGLVESAADDLEALSEGRFDRESAEATRASEVMRDMDAALDDAAAAESRLLQARIGVPGGIVPHGPGNVLQPGLNTVHVFVGPEESHAMQGLAIPDAALGFEDPQLTSARLTVVLAPLVPLGEAVRAEVDVPRVGRSPDVVLPWILPERGLVQARLVVLHRNRVLQTARITGRVGAPARLTDRIVLWDHLGGLDDRQPFDRTFVLNHAADGESRVVTHADGKTVISAMDETEAAADRIRDFLLQATQLRSKGAQAQADAQRILIDVAVEGHDLFEILSGRLERFGAERRIQIVSTRSARFLPLELVYDRPAPDADAELCQNWLAARPCGPECFADEEDTTVICPSVFWGLSRVIERQRGDDTDENGNAFVVSRSPSRRGRRLTAAHTLLAASRKVTKADVESMVTAIGAVRRATTWEQWSSELLARPADLLVLMPHTDPKLATLEISGVTLRRGRIQEKRHVRARPEVNPIVVLLGCDTAGSQQDPAGYATIFLKKGAAVVFSTLTMLLARHAATMSRSLALTLRDPARKAQTLGELVSDFRRDALREGLISALAVTAYGDADWKV